MIAAMQIVIMLQVRSFPTMAMVILTAPRGLVGVVPMLFAFHQPFGFNAILGLIGLAGIVMRHTLILTEQIKEQPCLPSFPLRIPCFGGDGVHTDRRNCDWHRPDPPILASTACRVVQNQTCSRGVSCRSRAICQEYRLGAWI